MKHGEGEAKCSQLSMSAGKGLLVTSVSTRCIYRLLGKQECCCPACSPTLGTEGMLKLHGGKLRMGSRFVLGLKSLEECWTLNSIEFTLT